MKFDVDFKSGLIRIGGIVALTNLFTFTQKLLGEHEPATRIVDISHELTASWNHYVMTHKEFADNIMIFSSLLVDLSVVYLMLVALFSRGWRTSVAAATVILLRQLCQFTIEFPIPEGLYFQDPYVLFVSCIVHVLWLSCVGCCSMES
jgi:hypothetical protein